MATVTEVRDLVFSYLLQSIDHKEFTRTFAKLIYSNQGDVATINLVSTLRPMVADAVVGLVNESDFRSALRERVMDIQVLSGSSTPVFKEQIVSSLYEEIEFDATYA